MKSVLITGGTGTLGYGLVEKLLSDDKNGPSRICILSRSEKDQAIMERKFASDKLRFFIGDVRDRRRLHWAMRNIEVVIHAAALKRIEACLYNPGECYATNVIGSQNVLEAATDRGVKKIVLVSTDKAFEPLNDSPYGLSKAMAEQLFRAWDATRGSSGPMCAGVRYGNVWCSAGSVVPLWRSVIAAGGVPYITDPDCTRFFMLLSEAVDFILAAVNQMRGGEIFVPHLPAYRLGDLFKAMTGFEAYAKTGLPSHEKLHEKMKYDECSKDAKRMSIEEIQGHLPCTP